MKKLLILYVIVFIFLLQGWCMAENEKKDGESIATMEEVVVTATKTELSMEKIGGSSVTVITAEDIKNKKLSTVEEVLKGVQGIDVKATGGLGTHTSIFMRGADSKNTLVLLDGIMVNDPSSLHRNADLANLTVDNIERIEVVRGPMSVLYGSNATAGVINIITKKGKGKPSVYAGTEGGSYGTWRVYGGTSGASDKFNFALAASMTETGGFSQANDENDRIPHAGNTSEDDGWKNTTISGKAGTDITPDFDINATVRFIDSEVEMDDFAWAGYTGDRFDFVGFVQAPSPNGPNKALTESNQIFGKIDAHNFFFDRFLESTLYYQEGRQDRKTYDNDGNLSDEFDAKNYEIAWQGNLNLHGMNIVSIGTTYFNESYESNTSSEESTDITSFWAQDHLLVGEDFIFVAGLRYDDHKNFGNKTTYRIAPAYTINQTETTLKASYGTGFRSPSLFELFADPVPAWAFLGGNENLKPETSKGWDVGIEQKLFENNVKIGATYFAMVFEDRIKYTDGTYVNDIGDTKTDGVEAFAHWMPSPVLDFLFNYTYTTSRDPDGNQLIYQPLNKISLNTKYHIFEKGILNLDIYWVDERDTGSFDMDKDGNPAEKLDAYTLVNVSALYDINDSLQVYGRIDNLFNQFYEESWSYATPGLSSYIGVKVSY